MNEKENTMNKVLNQRLWLNPYLIVNIIIQNLVVITKRANLFHVSTDFFGKHCSAFINLS